MPFPLLIPAFFFSSWLLMIFWGMISPDVGVATVGYPKAMLATIGLWLVVFPLASRGGKKGERFSFRRKIGREVRKGFENRGNSSSRSETVSDDEINITSSFNGLARRITSQNFRGGTINTNFGGVQLDLTDAALANNEATLNVKAFVGGLELTVPEEWDVQVNVSETLAGISDERRNTGSRPEGAPRLVITGSATIGGISVKNV